MRHIWERDVLTGFWWGNMIERGHLEDLGIDGEIWVFKKWD